MNEKNVNECLYFGCTMSSMDKWYACPLESNIDKVVVEYKQLGEYVVSTFNYLLDIFSNVAMSIIKHYPNKHVVNLALHHPKKRVRKKNLKRIMKYFQMEISIGEKMTIEEARKVLDGERLAITFEALNVAIGAIDKQIPKKVIMDCM